MSKKVINQNSNYDSEFIDSIGSNFIFDENPINRLKNTSYNLKENGVVKKIDRVPLRPSRRRVRAAINLLPVLKTLVAPMFPDPIFLTSPKPANFVRTKPNGIEPNI